MPTSQTSVPVPRERGAGSGAQRRQEIVAAAQRLIADKGFEGLRVREVADRVGINIATLHYHFPSKEALVAAVVQDIVGRLDRVPAGDVQPPPPREHLAGHLHHVLDQFERHREQFVVLNELYNRAIRDEALRRVLQASDTAWTDYLVPILRAGRDNGQLRADLDPVAAATLITGFFKSLLFHLGLTPQGARQAADELLRGLDSQETTR
ncbi:TetR/AcrR family transcriptional regulator [Micromonospora sediminicola]|uniref:TetR/AcrR family transcriptional regulator n=1 Tax=Micromonospora sediminicola TaxID=946078 RepID=UPI0033D79FFA